MSWNRSSVHRQRFSKSRISRLSRLVFDFENSSSLSVRSVMVIAVARGMDVNKETTSKETMVSSVLILRFCIWSRNVFTLPVVYGEDWTRGESNLDRNFETWWVGDPGKENVGRGEVLGLETWKPTKFPCIR